MKHDRIVDGEALRIEAVRGMLRALDQVGGADAMAQLLGKTMHRVTHWREIPLRHVFAVEAATGIPHYELRPDVDFSAPNFGSHWPNAGDWVPDDGIDVAHLCGAAQRFDGPDGVAAEEALIRAYLDARHRLDATRAALVSALGMDRV
ncbi:MAG: YdaS family helix-turn-helix protein [Devosia sp.]